MLRRSTLAPLGAIATGISAGCLTDGGTAGDQGNNPSTDGGTDGSSFDGDPAELVETFSGGIPRGPGKSLFEMETLHLAYVVRSASQADAVFAVDQFADEQTRAAAESFVENTNFDAEVLLQIEQRVPNSEVRVTLSEFTIRGSEGVVVYGTERNESAGGAASSEQVHRLLLRVDTATGGIQSFTVEHDGASFSPVDVDELT